MNQVARVYGESNECGNPFSNWNEKKVDEIKIEFDDGNDDFDQPPVQHDNTDCIRSFSAENKECGKSFTKDDVGNNNDGLIDATKIKVEDEK